MLRALMLALTLALCFLVSSHAATLHGIQQPLKKKAQQIVSACGSTVISGVRRTKIAGTNRLSLHAFGRAVDLQGNPSCIYKHLKNWPGGYSTDYARVKHVHISYGGPEHGRRFAHYSGRTRVAARSHYVSAQKRNHFAYASDWNKKATKKTKFTRYAESRGFVQSSNNW